MQHSNIIDAGNYPVYIGAEVFKIMENFLQLQKFKKSRFLILVDENTRRHCLGEILDKVRTLADAGIIRIKSGEKHKNLKSCSIIWQHMIDEKVDRHTVLVNLGGGVISDLGGFAAATFKRGIRYVNIPTSLTGQIDAAIGGKVGIDYKQLKNQIGLFADPQAVFIYPEFLSSLDEEHLLGGFAEIIKHGLIMDAAFWDQIKQTPFDQISEWPELISHSAGIKASVVKADPFERKYRKILNFGHTIGHAVESLIINNIEYPMTHGRAVAVGMICESWLSYKRLGLASDQLSEIVDYIMADYQHVRFTDRQLDIIMEHMAHDKKNEQGQIMFSLLQSIGYARINISCEPQLIRESLRYYQDLR